LEITLEKYCSIKQSSRFCFAKFESRGKFAYGPCVLQIVFNEISAAEISQLDTLEQLELLDEFKVTRDDLEHLDDERFGKIERDGKTLYRFRSQEWRFYFEVVEEQVTVHRVLHRGTFSDFLFRSKLPLGEDEALADSKHFWNLIDEGRKARLR
jgi:mRNA-degrading endonuclease RelE of RelBE toxin-antitoxin system